MAFLEKFPKEYTLDDLRAQLEKFVNGQIVMGRKLSQSHIKEIAHTGMFLLRHVPCARDSIFEFISKVYEEFVKEYMLQIVDLNNAIGVKFSDEEIALLEDIHAAFILYLESCGQIWAPILSEWTLQLLGQLSSSFNSKNVFGHCQSVNEVIQIWIGCKAIQSLLDLTSRSLTCRDHANEDTFISALLDTSATHSPHFDWVVAHVGNSYPQTIVTKVMTLGLQHFSSTPPTISKINSVAGILGHLVTTHTQEVQHAFHQLLEEALSSGTQTSDRNSETYSIPYLLQLCSSSVTLLDVLMDSVLPKIKEETLEKLIYIVPRWKQLHFGGQDKAILALVTHLILKSTRGPKALETLMCGCKSWGGCIGQKARVLLDYLTCEVSTILNELDSAKKDYACIPALKENYALVMRFLTDMDPQVSRTAKELVKLMAMHDGSAIGVAAACYYLRFATEDKHLWHLADLIAALELKYSAILQVTLKILVVKSELSSTQSQFHDPVIEEPLRIWKNILRLIKSEGMSQFPIRYKLTRVLQENLVILTPLLDIRKSSFSMEEGSLIVEIISKLKNLAHKTRFGDLLTLERYLVGYLFRVLVLVNNHGQKACEVFHISKLLTELSEDPAIQNDALRSLVQTSLDPDSRPVFMQTVVWSRSSMSGFDVDNLCDNDEFQPERFSMYVPLMKENQKRTASVCLSRAHSTSLHSGKLPKSELRNWGVSPKVQIKTNTEAEFNLKLFVSVLLNVCTAIPANGNDNGNSGKGHQKDKKTSQVSVDAVRKVALLLVEVVSPDVMFNGLPWPEEEFSKVQVERDLQIRRAFEHHPYLWDLLELVANHCPSLCYCSILLRALMATLMAHWTSSQEAKARNSPVQLEGTIRLINIMKTGQLLPPPLSYIGDVLHELKASEILHLLRDVWGYMRMNVPVPAVFTKDAATKMFTRNAEFFKVDQVFTEKLRLVLLNNVETLGCHYPKFFPSNQASTTKNGSAENGRSSKASS